MAIWDFILKIGGVDSETLGCFVESVQGPWDTPGFVYDEVQLPNYDGPIPTVDDPELEAKDFGVHCTLSFADESAYADGLDAFKYALAANPVTLISGDRDTRQRTGVLTSPITTTPYDGPITAAHCEFTIHCRNPLAADTAATTVTGDSTADIACALGTWKSTPILTVTSPTSPLTLQYKDSTGAPIGDPLELTFAGSPTTIVVDMAGTITVDGVRADTILTAGDFFRLDPRNGGATRAPKVRASSGSVSIDYAKQWL
jgi:hypothetical protein